VEEFKVTSPSFEGGQPIPQRYSCEGEDRSLPLAWSGVPEGTASLVLVVDDPDAPGGTFTHRLGWGIDPSAGGLTEGEATPVEAAMTSAVRAGAARARRPDTARTITSSGCTRSTGSWISRPERARPTWSARSQRACWARPSSSVRTSGDAFPLQVAIRA
jgi:Phosphatidylethanolamine-binding protein